MSEQATRDTQAIHDVIAERQRQIDAEVWTERHDDDEYPSGELMEASNTTTTKTTPPQQFKVGDRVWTTAPSIEASTAWDERIPPHPVTITRIEDEDSQTPIIRAAYESEDGTLSRDTNATVLAASYHFFRDAFDAELAYLDSLLKRRDDLDAEIQRQSGVISELASQGDAK